MSLARVEEILAGLPAEDAAFMRTRLRPPSQKEQRDLRDAAIREAAWTWYRHLAPSANAMAAVMAANLAVLQPIIARNAPEADGDGKRGALARILRLNNLNTLGPDRLEEIITGRR